MVEGFQIGVKVNVLSLREGTIFHIDKSLPFPYSVGFADTGEVCAFSSKELLKGECDYALSKAFRSL